MRMSCSKGCPSGFVKGLRDLIKVLCFRGQKRAVHFFTVSFTENQTCLGESAQGEEFSEGLKAEKPRCWVGS
jgi:hypothetical protein